MPDLPRKESPQLLRKRQGNATSVTVLPFMSQGILFLVRFRSKLYNCKGK
jgi:hypothetical protein